MLSNWADYLLQYNFTIVHCPGVLNILPDYLSRMYPGTNELASGTVKLNMVGEIPKKPVTELKQFIRERIRNEHSEASTNALQPRSVRIKDYMITFDAVSINPPSASPVSSVSTTGSCVLNVLNHQIHLLYQFLELNTLLE